MIAFYTNDWVAEARFAPDAERQNRGYIEPRLMEDYSMRFSGGIYASPELADLSSNLLANGPNSAAPFVAAVGARWPHYTRFGFARCYLFRPGGPFSLYRMLVLDFFGDDANTSIYSQAVLGVPLKPDHVPDDPLWWDVTADLWADRGDERRAAGMRRFAGMIRTIHETPPEPGGGVFHESLHRPSRS